MMACRRGSVAAVRALLAHGANPRVEIGSDVIGTDTLYRTALEAACYYSRVP